jgi:hypothetical protein
MLSKFNRIWFYVDRGVSIAALVALLVSDAILRTYDAVRGR